MQDIKPKNHPLIPFTLFRLPNEILFHIATFLTPQGFKSFRATCRDSYHRIPTPLPLLQLQFDYWIRKAAISFNADKARKRDRDEEGEQAGLSPLDQDLVHDPSSPISPSDSSYYEEQLLSLVNHPFIHPRTLSTKCSHWHPLQQVILAKLYRLIPPLLKKGFWVDAKDDILIAACETADTQLIRRVLGDIHLPWRQPTITLSHSFIQCSKLHDSLPLQLLLTSLQRDSLQDSSSWLDVQQGLHMAAKHGSLPVVHYLITHHQGNVHEADDAVLCEASANGQMEVVQYLLEMKDPANSDTKITYPHIHRALIRAIAGLHSKIVHLLARHGASLQGIGGNFLTFAAGKGDLLMVQTLLSLGVDIKKEGQYALSCSIANGHAEVVQCLLENGVELENDYEFLVRWAKSFNQLSIVQLLNKYRKDVIPNNVAIHQKNSSIPSLSFHPN